MFQLQKTFSPVCMLLVQLTLMNVFYSIWLLKNILIKIYYYRDIVSSHILAFFEKKSRHFEKGLYFTLSLQQLCNTNTKVPKKLFFNIYLGFSLLGGRDGRELPQPQSNICSLPPHLEKFPPVDSLPTKFLSPPTKGQFPPPNNNFPVITQ